MSDYKILLKISGSIAAYKSAYLASRLVQNGYQVQAVATPAALKFIGPATLEGLTGRKLLYNEFEEGEALSHIHLVKWADLTILAPGTANTINKFAYGIADNLVTSLFLAHSWDKPYLIAPAMNTAMMLHPATQGALTRLKSWGVKILDTDCGRLACGDKGYGKLLDPDKIVEIIEQELSCIHTNAGAKRKILITLGGTREKIDGAREISNISTGKTGATVADYFSLKNWEVTCLAAGISELPKRPCQIVPFTDFESLDKTLHFLLQENSYDAVIHLAAVSDYSVKSVLTDHQELETPLPGKIDSHSGEIQIRLRRNFKILNRIKNYAGKIKPVLVAFKFTSGSDEATVREVIASMKKESEADLIVWNDANSRVKGIQTNYSLFSDPDNAPVKCKEAIDLAARLEEYLSEKINNK